MTDERLADMARQWLLGQGIGLGEECWAALQSLLKRVRDESERKLDEMAVQGVADFYRAEARVKALREIAKLHRGQTRAWSRVPQCAHCEVDWPCDTAEMARADG
jgi:hypothetical protein